MEASSGGGASITASIDPVGGFLLGFGRGFLMATPGSACAPPPDVDATALLAMAVFVRGPDCGGFATFGGCKRSGRSGV